MPRIAEKYDLGFYKADGMRVKRQASSNADEVGSIMRNFRSGKKRTNTKDSEKEMKKQTTPEKLIDESDGSRKDKIASQQNDKAKDVDAALEVTSTQRSPSAQIGSSSTLNTNSEGQEENTKYQNRGGVSEEVTDHVITVGSGPIFVHDPFPRSNNVESAPGTGTVVEETKVENLVVEAAQAKEPMDESFDGVIVTGDEEEVPEAASTPEQPGYGKGETKIIFPEGPHHPKPDTTWSLINERGMDEGYPISTDMESSKEESGPEKTSSSSSGTRIIFPGDGNTPPVPTTSDKDAVVVAPPQTVQTVGVLPVIRDAFPEDEVMNEIEETGEMADTPRKDKTAVKPVDNIAEKKLVDGTEENPAINDMPEKPAMDNMPEKPAMDGMAEKSAMDDIPEKPAMDVTAEKSETNMADNTKADATTGKPETEPAMSTNPEPQNKDANEKVAAVAVSGASTDLDKPEDTNTDDDQDDRKPFISKLFKNLFGN